MAIQHRHGDFKDFDPNKMVTAELAVVTSGDPASPTGRTLYICFAPGIVKRIVSYEDFENELQNATEEIQQAFTQEIRTAITNSIAATNAANEAKKAADLAAEAARKAAEAAGAYVLGDISGKTVKFTEAEGRENINTGESTATMFGKIKKWFADLKNIAFTGDYGDLSNVPEIVNNRTTTKAGTVLDGRQGKDIQDQLTQLNTKNVPEYLESVGNVSPPAVNNGYSYATVPNLRTYRRLSMRAWVGDTSNYRIATYPPLEKNREFIVSAYASPNYNGRIGVLIDTDNNRIGVRAIALTGYTPSQCGIGTFIAEK